MIIPMTMPMSGVVMGEVSGEGASKTIYVKMGQSTASIWFQVIW